MKKHFFPNTILQIIVALIFSLILTTPWLFVINSQNQETKILLFFILMTLTFIVIIHLINWKRKVKLSYNFTLINSKSLLLLITILFLFEFGINIPINSFFNESNINPFTPLTMTFGVLIIGPILEEMIFRGIILKGLLISYSAKKAIIISAILFGLIHGKPLLILPAIIIGLFFGWIYYKTKSLGTTIVLHSITNLFALSGVFLIQKLKIYSSFYQFSSYRIISILISFIILTFIFKILYIKSNKTIASL
ncbi:MAG: type II CAAX endopeptidase family protein [Lutibacter sp.]